MNSNLNQARTSGRDYYNSDDDIGYYVHSDDYDKSNDYDNKKYDLIVSFADSDRNKDT